MRIGFITCGSFNDYGEKYAPVRADILCFTFSALGSVSYERELRGETNLFEDVAILSKEGGNIVVSGCYTSSRGTKRKSVVVAERGRILGVSDMVNRIDGSDYRAGAGVKIYDTQAGKLGVVVAEDVYFPHVFETLSVCGAEMVLCVFETLNEGLEQTLLRASAFLYGVPVCMCAFGYAQAADIGGKLRFASPKNACVFEYEREQEYHLVETRRRGFYLCRKSDF